MAAKTEASSRRDEVTKTVHDGVHGYGQFWM